MEEQAAENKPEKKPDKKPKKRFAGGRGKETLFKVSSRNQIEMIAIADNKANIITGINAIIMSFCVALLYSGFRVDDLLLIEKMEFTIPFALLLLFCLISAVFAILAAKPVIIRTRRGAGGTNSLLFFDFSRKESVESYKKQVRDLLSSKEAVYEQMMNDLYSNGMVLRRKYALLSVSYTIFLLGLVICTISTLLLVIFPPG